MLIQENNIGIILDDLGPSQVNWELIKTANASDATVFFFLKNQVLPCIPVDVCLLNMAELHDFYGKIITTNITNTKYAIDLKNTDKVFFYVWDLEWIRGSYDHIHNMEIFNNKKVITFTRSNEYAKAIKNCYNVTPIVTDIENIIDEVCNR